ncbi:hypothetical protein ACFQHO_20080 [Actinomadura yumaensis]|uniref:hypothetical protein n=1 Tax=Actinomadura yumaensis TaxID=111807 RepID=UPI00360BCAE9
MSEGVEWAVHCCLLLDWMGEDRPVSTTRLAAGFELPPLTSTSSSRRWSGRASRRPRRARAAGSAWPGPWSGSP